MKLGKQQSLYNMLSARNLAATHGITYGHSTAVFQKCLLCDNLGKKQCKVCLQHTHTTWRVTTVYLPSRKIGAKIFGAETNCQSRDCVQIQRRSKAMHQHSHIRLWIIFFLLVMSNSPKFCSGTDANTYFHVYLAPASVLAY